ncbi:MAG: TonB-dependent receptor [Bacteroidetes bacterium]|nr:TonB-dependent receptor [Bacteroidota bacterium]
MNRIFFFQIIGFLFLFFLISEDGASQTGTIKGRVFNHKNNEPLPFTNIILENDPQKGVSSDTGGNFTITKVTPGYVRLVASSVGFQKYVSVDFLVTNSKVVFVEIGMEESAVNLEAVEVKPSEFVRNEESPVSLQRLTIQEIERSPGSNRDVSKVIQSLPGVASAPSFRNDVIVRGGGASENRFYLDGVEIPNLNHFATQGASGGPVGIINVDFIREVEFYSGAFPAQIGNALSSVLEFNQIEGNKDKFSARLTLGSSDLGVTLNGPITKKSTLLFSYRRSYLNFLFSALKLPFLPTYNDYQLKYKIDLDKRNQISLISIGSLDNNKLNTGIKNPNDFQNYILGSLPEDNQWSYTLGIVYRHFRENGNGKWVFSRNMLNNEKNKYKDNIKTPDSLLLDYKSQESENKFRYEGLTDLVKTKILYGAGLQYAEYRNNTYQQIYSGNELKPISYNSYLSVISWNIFGQVTRGFFKDKLQLSLGIRMDANNYSKEMVNMLDQFSPRFSASYGITQKWFLNFNIGRYCQQPAYTSLGYRNNYGTLVNDSLGIRYINCDHIVLGVEFLPDTHSKFSMEGFYKLYSKYPFSIRDSVALASKGADYAVYGDEPLLSISKGRAYGTEILYRNTSLFGFNLILSYTYVRSEFTNYFGKYVASAWDNRNLLYVTVGRKFKHNWEIGMKWRFVGGAPYTPYDENKSSIVAAWDAQGRGYLDYARFNTLRLRSFNQLDLRVDKGFYFRKWSLMFYLDVQNVLAFKAQQPDILVNTQPDGSVVKYVDDKGVERYQLRYIQNYAGTILPSIGIMVEL